MQYTYGINCSFPDLGLAKTQALQEQNLNKVQKKWCINIEVCFDKLRFNSQKIF